jgi:hypothetical protein
LGEAIVNQCGDRLLLAQNYGYLKSVMQKYVLPTASKPATAAAMARALSSPLMVGTAASAAAGRWAGRCAGAAAAEGAAAVARRAGAAGATAWLTAVGGANGAAPGAADGPPGGRVGNLIVGAAEGFGGKLMRTVSFFGCTFELSGGLGGNAPPGKLGIFSAIYVSYFEPT